MAAKKSSASWWLKTKRLPRNYAAAYASSWCKVHFLNNKLKWAATKHCPSALSADNNKHKMIINNIEVQFIPYP